jgi:hypothetical protein
MRDLWGPAGEVPAGYPALRDAMTHNPWTPPFPAPT